MGLAHLLRGAKLVAFLHPVDQKPFKLKGEEGDRVRKMNGEERTTGALRTCTAPI